MGAAHAAERAREASSAAKAVLAEAEQRLSGDEVNSTVALAAPVSSMPGKAIAPPAAAAAEGIHGCDVRPLLSRPLGCSKSANVVAHSVTPLS